MPNWVINNIKVKGDRGRKKQLFQMFKDKVDFEKITPMPEELRDTVSPVRYERLSVEEIEKCDELKKKYGFDNWYDWSWENWGTKWNAFESVIQKKTSTLVFQTAWRTPTIFLLRLSRKFDKLRFMVEYADEDIGYNCGISEISNGIIRNLEKWEEGSEEAKRFANKLWGWEES